MKYILSTVSTFAFVLLLPLVSFAASASTDGDGLAGGDATAGELGTFLTTIVQFMNAYVIPLILAAAFLVFVWGVFKYFVLGGADSEKQEEGKSLMLYATIGFVLILSFYGIVTLLSSGLGFEDGTINTPTVDYPGDAS